MLSVLKEVWPNDPLRVRDRIVAGLYSFWKRRGGSVDVERLVPRLMTANPAKIMYSASLGVGDQYANVADVIERLYKKRTAK